MVRNKSSAKRRFVIERGFHHARNPSLYFQRLHPLTAGSKRLRSSSRSNDTSDNVWMDATPEMRAAVQTWRTDSTGRQHIARPRPRSSHAWRRTQQRQPQCRTAGCREEQRLHQERGHRMFRYYVVRSGADLPSCIHHWASGIASDRPGSWPPARAGCSRISLTSRRRGILYGRQLPSLTRLTTPMHLLLPLQPPLLLLLLVPLARRYPLASTETRSKKIVSKRGFPFFAFSSPNDV
jgi:hypothetical protein